MKNITLETDLTPSRDNIQKLGDGLNQHAIQNIGSRGFNAVAIWARNESGEIMGGVQAFMNWNWLHVCLIWLDESLRGQGLGTTLLSEIESIGRENGCTNAHLDTFSFQAKGFYERYGYEVYGCLEDYPPGQARYYLSKSLQET